MVPVADDDLLAFDNDRRRIALRAHPTTYVFTHGQAYQPDMKTDLTRQIVRDFGASGRLTVLHSGPSPDNNRGMTTRTHQKDDAWSEAVYSRCETYRYLLTRTWDARGTKALFVMLNPSTATEEQNDPTVERCERRARALGFGAFRVANIFAFRATDPRVMRAASDPVGPQNDAAISGSVPWADRIICAWGTHGAHLNRGPTVEALLRRAGQPLFHLGLTLAGHPKHPLYIGYAQPPLAWQHREEGRP